MTALTWDQVGERMYQAGVDRGVLYLSDGTAVPWNGLTGVEEGFNLETKQYHMDGLKYLERQIRGDFSGKLTAFTYPDEFEEVCGNMAVFDGFYVHDQKAQMFGLSYRTRIGNDVDGLDYGYRIHVLWNLLATPDTVVHTTLNDQSEPIEFAWSLSATPDDKDWGTAHISFRSTDLDANALEYIEELLYGTSTSDPELPSFTEMVALVVELHNRTIIDNGDGTWTASGASVTLTDPNTFQIEDIDATYLDADTYEIETTS